MLAFYQHVGMIQAIENEIVDMAFQIRIHNSCSLVDRHPGETDPWQLAYLLQDTGSMMTHKWKRRPNSDIIRSIKERTQPQNPVPNSLPLISMSATSRFFPNVSRWTVRYEMRESAWVELVSSVQSESLWPVFSLAVSPGHVYSPQKWIMEPGKRQKIPQNCLEVTRKTQAKSLYVNAKSPLLPD